MEPNYLLAAAIFLSGLAGLGAIIYFLIIFNGLIALRNDVKKSWADIDVILKQRYDELPNVIAAVKGYMAHEKRLLESVTAARSHYLGSPDIQGKLAAEGELAGPLKAIFAVAESYPDLKADRNFLNLQQRISGLEIEIADRREMYNASVNAYNTRIESLPDLIVASLLNLKPLEMYRVAENEKARPDITAVLENK